MRVSQPITLFAEYLRGLNASINEGRLSHTAAAFVAAADRAADEDGLFTVTIYANTPDMPLDQIAVRRKGDGEFEIVTRGKQGGTRAIEVPISLLDGVAEST